MPEVSVIIPTYNRVHLLPRTIVSVLNQEYRNFEVIIVDDGSTDKTEEIVRMFVDNRITYIKLSENSGWSSKPRNTGILNSKGKYLAFLDSDDEWSPYFLSKLTSKLQSLPNNVGVVYCGLIVSPPDNGRTHIVHYKRRGKVFPDSLEIIVCSTTASLIRRECLEKVGLFDEHDTRYDHRDMIIRLSKACEFDYVPEALAQYNCHEGQKSRKNLEVRTKAIMERYAEDYAEYPTQHGTVQLILGIEYARVGKRREALKYILPNLRYFPRALNDYYHTRQATTRNKLAPRVYLFLEILYGRRFLR